MPERKPQPARSVAIGTNPERTRSHNRRVVMETILQHGQLGRSDIAGLTRLTAQAVSNIVAELVGDGLLVEQGRRRTARGQPPIELRVNPHGGMTAGIEIGVKDLTMVLVDLCGTLRAQRIMRRQPGPLEILGAQVARELALLRAAPDLPGRLLGCGVVMPGPFETDGPRAAGDVPLPGWSAAEISPVLSRALGTSVAIENDATAAAVGEHLHGIGRSLRNFCLVYFGAGLGMGVIINGQPYRGAFGNAGELGHLPAMLSGRPWSSGREGSLERYASIHALSERLRAAGVPCDGTDDIEALHHAGHAVIASWTGETAALLGPVMAMLENLFDPETIVLGGGLPDGVIDALIAGMSPLPDSVANRPARAGPRIQRGATGRLTAALGAAALPLLETVAPRLDRTLVV